MTGESRTLSSDEARAHYDELGADQDREAWYEDPAFDDLITHTDFSAVSNIAEFGCGTGRLTMRLFEEEFPSDATYVGLDISPVMIEETKKRLLAFRQRVDLRQTNGSTTLPLPNGSQDLVISTYVLDLLANEQRCNFIEDAHRVLRPGGNIALISLTPGKTLAARGVSLLWNTVYRLAPKRVGGCRPVELAPFLRSHLWTTRHHARIATKGLTSEILIAEKT